jgi:8-oxo-dGTP diphosphatase
LAPVTKPVLVAAAAIVDIDGRVLVAQRPPGKSMAGLWEFPGGKVDDDEVPEAALSRELKEELGIAVSPKCFAPVTFASHGYDDFHLVMLLYLTRTWQGTPRGLEGQALKWVKPADLYDYAMPPADLPLIAPLIERLYRRATIVAGRFLGGSGPCRTPAMSVNSEADFTLPLIPEASRRNHASAPAAAFVPIAVALLGVAFVLVGGIKARDGADAPVAAASATAGAIVTGSIADSHGFAFR